MKKFSERNAAIIRDICDGISVVNVAKKHSIVKSRVNQIIAQVMLLVKSKIHHANIVYGKPNNYYVLGIECGYSELPCRTHILKYEWIYRLFLDLVNQPEESTYLFYKALKERQLIDLQRVDDRAKEITRRVLWGEELEAVAASEKMEVFDVAKLMELTCFVLDPEIHVDTVSHVGGDDYSVNWYRKHKRVFFDPIDVDLSNVKYFALLDYLEEGEQPQRATLPYLWELLSRKYPGGFTIGLALFHWDRLGRPSVTSSLDSDGTSDGRVAYARYYSCPRTIAVTYDNGLRATQSVFDKPHQIYIFARGMDYEKYRTLDPVAWADLLVYVMSQLAVRQWEHERCMTS